MTLFDQLEKKILIILFSEYGNHVTKFLLLIKITKVFKTFFGEIKNWRGLIFPLCIYLLSVNSLSQQTDDS